MKKIIVFLLLLTSLQGIAQSFPPGSRYTYIAQGYNWLRGYFQALNLPSGPEPVLQAGQWSASGGVFCDTLDGDGTPAGLYLLQNGVWVAAGNNIYNSDGDLTGNRSINAAGFDFQINDIGQLVLAGVDANIVFDNDLLLTGDSVKINSTSGRMLFPNLDDVDDTITYKPTVRDPATGRFRQFTHWPGSGLGYVGMEYFDDSTVLFVRGDGSKDTLVYNAGSGGSGVSNFIDLADGPGAFTGNSLKSIRVNSGETALEYYTPPTSGDVTKVGTPVDNQIGVWTGDGTIEGNTGLTWDGSKLVVTGGSAGVAGADIANGSYGSLLVGADLNAATRTNSTNKNGGIAAPHYTNSEEPLSVMRFTNTSSNNAIVIGQGVNPGYNSATSVGIYTASSNTTLVGQSRVLFNTNTKVQFNDPGNNYDFQVSGDVDANTLYVDADGTTNGAVGIGTASPSAKLDINSDVIRLRTAKTPASATAAGNAGDICWDASYIYVCVATNTWVRAALATW